MKKRFLVALFAILLVSALASIFVAENAVSRNVEKLILERAADRLSLIAWSFGVTSSDVDIYSYIDFNHEVLEIRKGKILIFQYGTARVSLDAPGTRRLDRVSGSYQFTLFVDIVSSKVKYLDLVRTTISVTTAIFSLMFGVFGLILLHSAIDPIVLLANSMARITSRNLQTRIPVPSRKDEFRQLISTFNALMDEIQGTYERQSQFVEDMTHDIVTPVQVLEGYRQLIERHGKRDSLVDEYLEISKVELGRLKAMAGSLKAILAAEKRRNVERADASAVTARITGYYAGLFPSIRFEARIDAEVILPIGENDLERIEHILIDNAVKYGIDGDGRGSVLVILRRDHLSVRDDGPGIPQSERESIFDRRYRGRNTDDKTEGAGLGLSILKKFAEEYGFRIVVESEVGRGTEFNLLFGES